MKIGGFGFSSNELRFDFVNLQNIRGRRRGCRHEGYGVVQEGRHTSTLRFKRDSTAATKDSPESPISLPDQQGASVAHKQATTLHAPPKENTNINTKPQTVNTNTTPLTTQSQTQQTHCQHSTSAGSCSSPKRSQRRQRQKRRFCSLINKALQ